MALLNPLKAIVSKLLAQYGRAITIVRVTSVSDPVSGVVTKVKTDVDAYAYFDKVTQYNAPAGATVELNDVLAYIDTELTIRDQVTREGVTWGVTWSMTWSVIHVDPVELEDGVAIWVALLRR